MKSRLRHSEINRFQLLAKFFAIMIGFAAVASSGCISGYGRYELDKAEEDRKVMESSDESADEMLQSHPEYLTNVDAVTEFAAKIETRCMSEELPRVRAALRGCRDAISNGASMQERRECFRRLYEFQYREFLRWTHRRAREIADELYL